eukprot:TRINITY_DN2359_c0_g1_i2.p1 TRINITY_DN2359_c0_g1~~TRINITY_DN2359_c0_g1_i2.p1  ORF type:complete len:287 (+),score=3.60 TRINITY_DN2359_c0_g1_i2:2406-3266(+)
MKQSLFFQKLQVFKICLNIDKSTNFIFLLVNLLVFKNFLKIFYNFVFKKLQTKYLICLLLIFYRRETTMILDNQIFIALLLALVNGIFAVRLGIALYKQHSLNRKNFSLHQLFTCDFVAHIRFTSVKLLQRYHCEPDQLTAKPQKQSFHFKNLRFLMNAKLLVKSKAFNRETEGKKLSFQPGNHRFFGFAAEGFTVETSGVSPIKIKTENQNTQQNKILCTKVCGEHSVLVKGFHIVFAKRQFGEPSVLRAAHMVQEEAVADNGGGRLSVQNVFFQVQQVKKKLFI